MAFSFLALHGSLPLSVVVRNNYERLGARVRAGYDPRLMADNSGKMSLSELASKLHLKNPEALSPALAAALSTTAPAKHTVDHAGRVSLHDVSFRIVDIEATGLSTIHDELIEVAVYELRAGKVTKLLDTLVRPMQALPPRITELTGITPKDLEHAPALASIAEHLLEALSGDSLVAHSAQSDVGYLSQIILRFDPHWICPPVTCTLKLSRELLKEQSDAFGLLALAERLHLPLPTHRAGADAICTARLLEHLIDIARSQHSAERLDDLIALSQRKQRERPQSLISPLIVDTLPDTPGVYRFFGANNQLLYVGQSSSLRRRVKEHLYRAASPTSLEILKRAVRVDIQVCANELEAFVAEGDAITQEKPALNARNSEHGHVRYLRLSSAGAVTLVAKPTEDPHVRHFGPLVLSRSERVVLRAVREAFGLSPRDPKVPAPDAVARFVRFAESPLEDRPQPSKDADDDERWLVLLDVKQSIHRSETERLDATRPFRHPTLVSSARNANQGEVFAIGVGRPTLRMRPTDNGFQQALSKWLDSAPIGNTLDDMSRRISAYVRAHPTRVQLESVESVLQRQ